MAKIEHTKIFFRLFCLFFTPLLYFFYIKYVPLVTSFQMVLLPVLLVILLLASFNFELGTLFLVFAFPLINSLPYFFGIYEHIPHAPTALVLFLFYFLGWCIHLSFSPKKLSFNHPIFKPMILFSLFILISGFINFLRFSNFFPLVSDRVYELITNVNGVTAGGAVMSTLFHSLNYLTGFVFLFVLLNTIKSKKYAKKIIVVLFFSMVFSLMIGFYQYLRDMSFGNMPFWVNFEQINSTFKDPNSFGAFLAAMVPLVLSMICVYKRAWKALYFVFLLFIIILFPHVGTRSAFLGLLVSLIVFVILYIKVFSFPKILTFKFFKSSPSTKVVLLIIIVVFLAGLMGLNQSRLFFRFKNNINNFVTTGKWVKISPERYFLWKEALHMIKDYPLTGVGIGAYIIELPNYYTTDKNSYEFGLESFRRIDSAENYFLHGATELGVAGLILVGWIFWIIFKNIGRSFKIAFNTDKEKLVLLGISAGIVSLFTNLFFHSYIGSFEIKYMFWLLVGLVIVWGRLEGKPQEKIDINRKHIILGVFCILFFGGIHFWNCTHSLSLKNRTELFDLKQNFGLYEVEMMEEGQKFQWTREYGGMTLEVDKPVIAIPLHASHPDIKEEPVKVEIYLVKEFFKKKRLLDEVILNDSVWRTYKYSIPEETGKEIILLIKVSRTWNPQRVLGIPDPRNLGVALGEIVFY